MKAYDNKKGKKKGKKLSPEKRHRTNARGGFFLQEVAKIANVVEKIDNATKRLGAYKQRNKKGEGVANKAQKYEYITNSTVKEIANAAKAYGQSGRKFNQRHNVCDTRREYEKLNK